MDTERELTGDELDAVSGGAFPIVRAQMALAAASGTGGSGGGVVGGIRGETMDTGHPSPIEI